MIIHSTEFHITFLVSNCKGILAHTNNEQCEKH